MSILGKHDKDKKHFWTPRAVQIMDTLHPALREVLLAVGYHTDVVLLEGYRDRETQEAMKAEGSSRHDWPHSLHNRLPALAMDVVPYPAGADSPLRLAWLAGRIIQQGRALGVGIAWGGDPDRDGIFLEKDFRAESWRHFILTEGFRL